MKTPITLAAAATAILLINNCYAAGNNHALILTACVLAFLAIGAGIREDLNQERPQQ